MRLAIVIPCYNEEEVLLETTKRLSVILDNLHLEKLLSTGSIYYIDDGSKDETWSIICQLSHDNHYVHGIKLAHNVGHQNALWAGLENVVDKCDIAITIDADLQDDINCIQEMLVYANSGCDVVYGVRRERKTDTIFKRTTALGFYKFMHRMGVNVVYNHADYRLMSQRAIKALLLYPERNLFLRGIVPLIGYQSTCVYYDRSNRFAGESKYPLTKMLNFAIDGITSFSIKPLRLIFSLGFVMTVLSLCFGMWALVEYCCGNTIPGWTSLLLSIWFIGGIQLLSVGILGEYIGKTYKEVKRRPRYFIEKQL